MVEELKKSNGFTLPGGSRLAEQMANLSKVSLSPALLESMTSIQKSITLNPTMINAIKSAGQSAAVSKAMASWYPQMTAANVLSGLDLSAFNKVAESQAAAIARAMSPLAEIVAKQQADTAELIAKAISPYLQMREDVLASLASITARLADIYSTIDLEGLQRRALLPSNLPTQYEALLPDMKRLLEEEGIPLAWVPRQEIVAALLSAESAGERTEILLEHAGEIVDDCAELIIDMDAVGLADVLPIAREVVGGFRAGNRKIAAISAVAVTNTVVEQNKWATTERSAKKHYAVPTQVNFREFTMIATLAALIVFYREWHPKSPAPMPDSLARHVVSHNLKDEHLNDRNCLIAVMLMTSLMQTVQHETLRPRVTEVA